MCLIEPFGCRKGETGPYKIGGHWQNKRCNFS
uniref:Uncharacterized protein n=1 Tax=Arundo donax TaxID=35708 RepID=A0A0A8ZEY5_ARUDO